uniref:Dynamin-type G domain-containing protein n=1 Tax=Sphenodon punctatus TaxID=8508 RepID=A0A8D0L999_SPHPU
IDSLRALGVEKDLALPAIAVIGDQSSGKSSVLEALSGVALPRGSGIVTRCPLALRLKKMTRAQGWKGNISYLDVNLKLQDPSEVEKEIRKGECSIFHSEKGIKRLIKKIIAKEETINLVVVPSNVDIATTEALKMAQEVDPEGERTLGILTKPDLVDKGTEESVVDIVRNLIIHLKKGYMIVKCRGQQDIQKNLSLASAIQNERAFFEENEHFRILLDEKRATVPLLAEKLTSELVEHINKSLPTLEEQINTQLQKATQELCKYGKSIPETQTEKLFFLIDKIRLFNQDLMYSTHGEEKLHDDEQVKLFTKIRQEFQKWGEILDKNSVKGKYRAANLRIVPLYYQWK